MFFNFTTADSAFGSVSILTSVLMWLCVFAALFLFNEVSRRFKWVGFAAFVVLPIVLTVLWFTVLDSAYKDWFHLSKVYLSTAGCIIFWCIRFVHGTNKKTGEKWHLSEKKWALFLAPFILAANILVACLRDFEVARLFGEASGSFGAIVNEKDALSTIAEGGFQMIGGPWNIMNGIAGLLNIVAITGWFGIKIRKKTKLDGSRDMLWPDMLWFYIIAYDIWNFAYTYNCLPSHAWYCGLALLLAPTLCAFTVGKGAWLQHRAQTLAIWCMFAQTFPVFQDHSKYRVDSAYNPTVYTVISALALAANVAIVIYMIYKAVKAKKNPWTNDINTDNKKYQQIAAMATPLEELKA